MLQLSRGWCHISVENCICSWLRLSYFIILGSLLCNESLFHDLLFHNLLLTSNYRCQINVVKWSAMFPSAVFYTRRLKKQKLGILRKQWIFLFSPFQPRLPLPFCLTWRLFWKSGVWASPATSAPPYTSLNLCWWWAPRYTFTLTSTTPSSPTFRYGYTHTHFYSMHLY